MKDIKLMLVRFPALLFLLITIATSNLVQADNIDQCKIDTAKHAINKPPTSITFYPDQILKRDNPELLLGFNVNLLTIQRYLLDKKSNSVSDGAISLLSELQGVSYRYPGGHLSNQFNWKWSIGALDERPHHRMAKWLEPVRIRFGLNEFLDFVEQIKGEALYTVNLVGWDEEILGKVLSMETIKDSNIELAQYLRKKKSPKLNDLIIELGNELDRGLHQWSVERYVKRAKIVAVDIKKILPESRILIPLRDWDWSYKGSEKTRGKQKSADMISQTMKEFPDVYGISFHLYYHPDTDKYPYWDMRKRIDLVEKSYLNAIKSSGNKNLKVWITEHAIQRLDVNKTSVMNNVSPPMQSALMSAKFITLIFDRPYIEGASLHELNQGSFNNERWKILSVNNKNSEVKGMPNYRMLNLLRSVLTKENIKTDIKYPFTPIGDNDKLSALVFNHKETGKLSLFIVNSGESQQQVEFGGKYLSNKEMTLDWSALCDQEKELVHRSEGVRKFNDNGRMLVTIPKYSISTIELSHTVQ